MKIGYACINMTLPSKFKTCRLKTIESEGIQKVKELTLHNLTETLNVIKWNIENNIHFYRLSSNLVPFATHPIMTWEWGEDEDVHAITGQIKSLQEKYGLRLSLHPGQYTILNSPKEEIVQKSILDLVYHQKLLDLVGGTDMILHVGGAYGDKKSAKERFIHSYQHLPKEIKKYLRIENDDKIFTIVDVLDVCKPTGAAACFDIHHHNCNHEEETDINEIIERVVDTWKNTGTMPKMHISSGRNSKIDRSHHDFVFEDEWRVLVSALNGKEADIMVEAKRKEEAVLKIKSFST
jgi:UV DNA damage endonuclease